MIEFKNIQKKYKDKVILNNINMTIEDGETVVLIGESGCGKTTLLKIINHLIEPTSGSVIINGVDTKEINDIKLRRGMGYVIQQTGLFPHKTIRENIELVSKLNGVSEDERIKKTRELSSMVGLNPDEYLNRFPTELSGGQQQRVGFARAFATDPDIILMDEPFSALDPMTRSDLQDELVTLQQNFKKTLVFVTHDMDEAIKIADKICIVKSGNIIQYDTPENILKSPADDYVSNFVGKNRIWASPEYIKVNDIMIEKPFTANRDLPIFRCIEKMRYHNVDSLVIMDKDTGKYEGVVRAKQLRNIENKKQRADTAMLTDIPSLNPSDTIIDAITLLNKYHLSNVPVISDDGLLKGLITKSSLMTTLSQQYLDLEVE